MSRRRFLPEFFLLLSLVGCGSVQTASGLTPCLRGTSKPGAEEVAFSELVGEAGASLDGRRVRVRGFLIFEFERTELFESKSSFEAHESSDDPPRSAMWIEVEADQSKEAVCSRRNALLEGVYERNFGGSTHAGRLRDVSYVGVC